jgi:hypothetical protein
MNPRVFEIASAIADEFIKSPLKYVSLSPDGDDPHYEVAGFFIHEDHNDPVMSVSLTGEEPIPGRFHLVITATDVRPATYWEPEEHYDCEVGKADNLIDAVKIVARTLHEQAMKLTEESAYYAHEAKW